MAATRHLGPARDVVAHLHPPARRPDRFLREVGARGRHLDALSAERRGGMRVLVIDARRRGGRLREPVERDVRQEFVLREDLLRIAGAVAPRAELLDDPGRETGRRIVQRIAERLWLRALDALIAGLLVLPRLDPLEPLDLRRGQAVIRIAAWRRTGAAHVQVQSGDVRRVVERDARADDRSPGAALHTIPGVAKPRHQGRFDRRHPRRVEAPLARLVRESKSRQRRRHDIERVVGTAAVSNGIGQWSDHFRELDNRPRPAVRDEERQRIALLRTAMDEMDLHTVDRRRELLETVQRAFLRAPVEAVAPVADQRLEIRAAGAVGPFRPGNLVGEPRPRQPGFEVGELGIGNVDGERGDARVVRGARDDAAGAGQQEDRNNRRDRAHTTPAAGGDAVKHTAKRLCWMACLSVSVFVVTLAGDGAKATRINRAIDLLAQGQPIYYTGSHEGTEGNFEQGVKDAQTYADYISYDMEHAPFDVKGLSDYMKGLAKGGPTKSGHKTPAVIVNVPVNGTDAATVRANAWMFQQVLATGVHGILLCHADDPAAVRAFVESVRMPIHKQGVDHGISEGRRGVHGNPTAARIWGVSVQEYQDK